MRTHINNTSPSPIHSSFDGRDVRPLVEGTDYALDDYEDLYKIGIGGLEKIVEAGYGMDAIQQDVTTPSIGVPVQFLQNWLSGFVNINTAARKIDQITGIITAGAWSDEQIVQGVLEMTGAPVPYSDLGNIPLSSYNSNFVTRTVVRYELGMKIGPLEEARQAAMRIAAAAVKRDSVANQLEITRNRIGFFGYNAGNNNTYGFLNDPQLPSYASVASGTGGLTWVTKTMQEITVDILTAVGALVTNSQDTINPEDQETTLTIPTNRVQYLNKINDFGISAKNWINQTYPKMRIISAPELNGANGGSNVFYLFADSVNDTSSDDRKTFVQVVPAKFQVLGVQQLAKGYEEDYLNASAGVMCKRPYAVVRYTGI